MRTAKILNLWQTSRIIVVAAILAIAGLKEAKAWAWDLDFHYRGPGSEVEAFEQQVEADRRREACERVGTEDERDGDYETLIRECV